MALVKMSSCMLHSPFLNSLKSTESLGDGSCRQQPFVLGNMAILF